MRVKTHRDPLWGTLQLEVEKPDVDGDVLISTRTGVIYIDARDVPALVRALRWAVRETKGAQQP